MNKPPIKVLSFPAFKNKQSNPYNYLLFSEVQKLHVEVIEFSILKAISTKVDIIHIHWPEFYLNSKYRVKAWVYSFAFLVVLMLKRLFGTKVVWSIHNLSPHKIQYKFLNKLFWKAFLSIVDGICSLSKSNESAALKTFPQLVKCQKAVTYHGLYEVSEEYKNITQDHAKEQLGIDSESVVFLCLGQIKEYKNYEGLISAFSNIKSNRKSVLLIAGKPDSQEYLNSIKALASPNSSIYIYPRFISDSELEVFFSAANYSIIAYDKIFNSGSMLLSISMGTPVIVPITDNFTEYQRLTGNEIILYQGKLQSSDFEEILSDEKSFHRQEISQQLSWTQIATDTVELYQNLTRN